MHDARRLIQLLTQKKLTLSMAESASAGYASYLLTTIPGASRVFKGSVIVYAPESKHAFFKLPLPLLKKTGCVSKHIAQHLAHTTRILFNTDISGSLVGFAGSCMRAQKTTHTKSKIETKEKTGLFYIAAASHHSRIARTLHLSGTRDQMRKHASRILLRLLLELLHTT